MRNLINIISETVLYRGDSSKIDRFDIDKTKPRSLFGAGIYLTDDPAIASDYTAARGTERVFPGPYDDASYTVKDLLTNYVVAYAREHMILPSAAMDILRPKMSNLRVLRLTTDEFVLVKKRREGQISRFHIPEWYMAKVLHAEMPVPDDVLLEFRQIYLKMFNMDNNIVVNGKKLSFDGWLDAFKKNGVEYNDDENPERWMGGHGKNPTIDELLNGLHIGTYAFRDTMFEKSYSVIKALQSLGYVGFEYSGGMRVGSYTRGGGGKKHRAFVFWNTDDLEKFRLPNKTLQRTSSILNSDLPELETD